MIQNRIKSQKHNDGVAKIYSVTNSADYGNMPKESLEFKLSLRFERRTIGINRRNLALQSNAEIEMLIRCPYCENVSTQDVAVIESKQYKIFEVQVIEGIYPNVMDLSLVRLEADYDNTE